MNYDRLTVKRGESAALGLWGGDLAGGEGGEVSLAPKLKMWLNILLKIRVLWIDLL